MKKLLVCLSISMALSVNAYSLENTVPPKVTDVANHNPSTALYVGNSYSFYNCGVHSYVRGLTKESGKKWKARLTTISSGKLAWHDVKQYLSDKEGESYVAKDGKPMFDFVLLQGQSSEPISDKASPLFRKYLKEHIQTIKKAGSIPVVVMTWAKQDKPEQTKALADATITAANENDAIVLPVGLAFAESLKQRPDLILHQKDKSHPTAAGSYLYGAMIYGLLFKQSPEGMKYLGECEKPISEKDAAFLQSVAWKTLKDFYGWK